MQCSVIRDLLPIYEEGLCSEKTYEVVEKHIRSCKECREIHSVMQKAIDIRVNNIDVENINLYNDVTTEYNRDCNGKANEKSIFLRESKLNKEEREFITQNKAKEFWRKYYGRLYIKGLLLFFILFIVIIGIKLI